MDNIKSYLKCIVYDKLLKPRQLFRITLYFVVLPHFLPSNTKLRASELWRRRTPPWWRQQHFCKILVPVSRLHGVTLQKTVILISRWYIKTQNCHITVQMCMNIIIVTRCQNKLPLQYMGNSDLKILRSAP